MTGPADTEPLVALTGRYATILVPRSVAAIIEDSKRKWALIQRGVAPDDAEREVARWQAERSG